MYIRKNYNGNCISHRLRRQQPRGFPMDRGGSTTHSTVQSTIIPVRAISRRSWLQLRRYADEYRHNVLLTTAYSTDGGQSTGRHVPTMYVEGNDVREN